MYKYAWWAEDSKEWESDLNEVGSRGQGGGEGDHRVHII
jgi:hypothetical protein